MATLEIGFLKIPIKKGGVPQLIRRYAEVLGRDEDEDKNHFMVTLMGSFKGETG